MKTFSQIALMPQFHKGWVQLKRLINPFRADVDCVQTTCDKSDFQIVSRIFAIQNFLVSIFGLSLKKSIQMSTNKANIDLVVLKIAP